MGPNQGSGSNPLAPDNQGSKRRHFLTAGGAALGALVLGVPTLDQGLHHRLRQSAIWENAAAVFDLIPSAPAPPDWHPGDLHSHTDYSHDVCGSLRCSDPETFGFSVSQQLLAAELRGLSYLAITDHDTVGAQSDRGYASDTVTLLDGYEETLAHGHAGLLGIDTTIDRETDSTAKVRDLVAATHDRGGAVIANHPRTDISSRWQYPGPAGADAVEVWSIAWYLQERTRAGPLASNNPDALALYDRYLNEGHQLGLVGGSDNHWRSSSMLQGVGQPTTWIRAPSCEQAALLEGLRAGRTVVSWDWLGPFLSVALEHPDGRRARIGDTVAGGTWTAHVTVTNGIGHRVRLVLDGEPVETRLVTSTPTTWTTDVELTPGQPHSWLRAEAFLEERIAMRALTSPIYVTEDGTPATPRELDGSAPIQTATTATGDCGCHSPAQRRAFANLDLALGAGRAEIDFGTVGALERELERRFL